MSIKLMTQVFASTYPTHTQKLVMLALADSASDEGFCWPSIPTLARKCSLAESGLKKQVRILKASGNLLVQTGGGRKSNRYTVNPGGHAMTPTADGGGHAMPPREAPHDPQGVTPCPPGGHAMPPNHNRTVKEPSENLLRAEDGAPGSGGKKAKGEKVPGHNELIRSWCELYEQQWGRKYAFGGRDARCVDDLLTATGMEPKPIMDLVCSAWSLNGEAGFHASRAVSLIYVSAHWNEIVAEMEKCGKLSRKTGRARGDFEGQLGDLMTSTARGKGEQVPGQKASMGGPG